MKEYPELHQAAYNPKRTYSEETIRRIIEYAHFRGIRYSLYLNLRVIPEFDVLARKII